MRLQPVRLAVSLTRMYSLTGCALSTYSPGALVNCHNYTYCYYSLVTVHIYDALVNGTV